MAINHLGQVLGRSSVWMPDTPNGTTGHIWQLGVIAPESNAFPECGVITEAHGINDKGEVVGISGSGFHYKGMSSANAFKTRIGRRLDKSCLIQAEMGSVPYAINNRGVIVGATEDASTSHAIKWSPKGRLAVLGKLKEDDPACAAVDINESGTIVGYSGGYPDEDPMHAWVLTGSHKRDLGLGTANAVNNHNVIVGVSQKRACIWVGSRRQFLDDKTYAADYPLIDYSAYSTALDINDSGQVVGFISASKKTPDGVWHPDSRAALWEDGATIDLNDVVQLPDGRILDRAVAINNGGQILCRSNDCAFLLTPFGEAKQKPLFGVNQDFVWTDDKDIPGLIQAMKDARVQSVRLGIRWTVVEPERGKWSFTRVDKIVRQIRAAKIDILCTLMSVPAWASGIKPAEVKGFWDCFAPKDMKDWEEYVRRVVSRYSGDIRCWEIWNEENGQDFYKPLPDAEAYVSILKSSYITIKKVDPKATVVLGGLQMNGIIPNPWSPIKIEHFLQKIYDAGGKPYFDVVNIHPYVTSAKAEGPAYCAKLTRDTVSVMKKNGDAKKPLWITETGLPTDSGVTETLQAEHLRGIFREIGAIPQVKALFWFTLHDYPHSICGGEDSMGMIATDGRRKPSFDAYKKLAE